MYVLWKAVPSQSNARRALTLTWNVCDDLACCCNCCCCCLCCCSSSCELSNCRCNSLIWRSFSRMMSSDSSLLFISPEEETLLTDISAFGVCGEPGFELLSVMSMQIGDWLIWGIGDGTLESAEKRLISSPPKIRIHSHVWKSENSS